MKALLFLLGLTSAISSFAQKIIKLEEAKDHVGDSVFVEGKIYGVKVFVDDDKKPTVVLLNLGGEYPNQLLTVAVQPSYRTSEIVMPNESSKGEIARVKGRIVMYNDKPQIVVRSSNELALSSGDAIVVPKQ
jgi:hypothetical protein